jgi:hypothetical protein
VTSGAKGSFWKEVASFCQIPCLVLLVLCSTNSCGDNLAGLKRSRHILRINELGRGLTKQEQFINKQIAPGSRALKSIDGVIKLRTRVSDYLHDVEPILHELKALEAKYAETKSKKVSKSLELLGAVWRGKRQSASLLFAFLSTYEEMLRDPSATHLAERLQKLREERREINATVNSAVEEGKLLIG